MKRSPVVSVTCPQCGGALADWHPCPRVYQLADTGYRCQCCVTCADNCIVTHDAERVANIQAAMRRIARQRAQGEGE